ncbi:MAG: cytochrome P450 [Nannocystis sp.]|nr:cytochrome P450 [Nannocystis sp.]
MTTLLERAFFGRAPLPRVDLPGPPARPLVGWRGNLVDLMRDPLAALYRVHACCGELGGLTEGNGAMVFAFGPEHNRALSTDVDRMVPFLALFPAPEGSAVERIRDHILFSVHGERHSEERRVLGPPLHRRRLERWVAAIDAIAEQHVAALPRGAVIDAPAILQTFTLEVILRIVFGVDAADRSRAAEAAAMRDFLTRVLDVLGDPSAALLPIDLPGFPYRRALHLVERFEREARRLAASSTADGLITDLSAPPREALTGRLFALLTAGHETGYAALCWILALLAQHPAVLAELAEELRALGPEPGFDALWAAPLLDAVIKESLRVLPTAAYGARRLLQPLELGGVPLAAGAVVVFSHLITHHLARCFPDPHRFDPSRWRGPSPSPWAYLPFGSGPRACPGADLARVEIKIFLARFLARYWPELPEGDEVVPKLRLTLRPERLRLRLLPAHSRLPRPIDAGPRWRRLVAPGC